MAKYRVLEVSFINDTIVEPGTIVEYGGEAGKTLELIEDEAPKVEPKAEKPKAETKDAPLA